MGLDLISWSIPCCRGSTSNRIINDRCVKGYVIIIWKDRKIPDWLRNSYHDKRVK